MKNKSGAKRRGFSARLYSKLKTSMLAALFTSYHSHEIRSVNESKFCRKILSPAAFAVSSKISSCMTTSVLSKIAGALLSLRLKVYGAFLASFGVYSTVFYLAENFLLSEKRSYTDILVGVIATVASLPLMFSDETLSGALTSSRFGAVVSGFTGIREDVMRTGEAKGRPSHGFLLGIAAGLVSYFTSPLSVIAVLIGVTALWLIMTAPEFGVIAIALTLPFVKGGLLTALLAVTLFSFILKLVRGKRFITFETIDVAVFGIFLVLIFSAISTGSHDASDIPLTLALYLMIYFIAANLMRSREWLERATVSLVFGTAIASAIIAASAGAGIFFPGVKSEVAGLFRGSMLGFRLGGNDPAGFNMILAVAFPVALSHFVSPPEGGRRSRAALAMIIMTVPLIEYGSFFAIISIIASMMLLLMIYSSKFIYLPVALAGAAAGGAILFPAAADRVLKVLGSGFDSFSSVRNAAWGDAGDILSRAFIGGVGFGEESYKLVSAAHINGYGAAGHAYNTYLQFWIESGIIGFVLLVAFVWLTLTAAFTVFDRISLAKKSPALKMAAMSGKLAWDKYREALPYSEVFSVTRRMALAGPFCSLFGMFIYGMGDYVWSEARVFMFFWLAAGIFAAGVRGIRDEIKDHEASYYEGKDPATTSECYIRFD